MQTRTKHMALGAALGSAGVAVAIALFHGRREILGLASPRHDDQHGHREKHHRDENGRGEYGKKHRRHKGHGHGD